MPELVRELSYYDLLFIAIGNIIGGGVFSLMGRSIRFGKGFTWIYILLTGGIVYLMSHGYTDLMNYLKNSESEFDIAKLLGGNNFAILFTILSTISAASTVSVLSLSFSEHLNKILNIDFANIKTSIIIIIAIALINIIGIRQSSNITNFITIIEVTLLIIISSLLFTNFNKKELVKKPDSMANSFVVPLIILFAFTGSEMLSRLAGESINPQKDIPNAINKSIIVTTLLYTFVCMSMISILGSDNISNTPIVDIFTNKFGAGVTGIISIIALASIFNTILVSNISGSRSLYGLGKKLNIPIIDNVDSYTKTPINSTIITSIISIIILLILQNIESLAIFHNIFIIFTLVVINAAAYKLSNNSTRSFRNITSIIIGILFMIFGGKKLIN